MVSRRIWSQLYLSDPAQQCINQSFGSATLELDDQLYPLINGCMGRDPAMPKFKSTNTQSGLDRQI
jgi:hypothetical protein